jgi:hypothetical protein
MSEPLRVRRLGVADADSIAEFLRAAGWEPEATPESVRETLRTAAAANPFEPGVGPPLVGVFVGSRLAAYLTSIPTRFWNGTESVPGHWLKGFWVLEPYRNGPVGYLLLKEMLKHVGLAASMPAALVPRRLSAALGMRDLGAVRNYIAPLRSARILRKLDFERYFSRLPIALSLGARIAKTPAGAYTLGALVTLGVSALRLPSVLSGRSLRSELSEKLPEEAALDALWARAQGVLRSAAVRSGAYLRWRYQADSNGRYVFASVWRGRGLTGLAVLQRPERLDDPRIAGLGIGSVVDLVLDPQCPGALPAALGVARHWARSADYDALLVTASHRGLRGPLLRAGYIPTPGNIHVMLREPGAQQQLSADLNDWMVTRGDAWSDHL